MIVLKLEQAITVDKLALDSTHTAFRNSEGPQSVTVVGGLDKVPAPSRSECQNLNQCLQALYCHSWFSEMTAVMQTVLCVEQDWTVMYDFKFNLHCVLLRFPLSLPLPPLVAELPNYQIFVSLLHQISNVCSHKVLLRGDTGFPSELVAV